MRLTGPNVFGPPKDRGEAIRALRAAVAGGVNHIDTAQFYRPEVVNELIREALHSRPSAREPERIWRDRRRRSDETTLDTMSAND